MTAWLLAALLLQDPAADVRRLIDQLDSDTLEEREGAERKLKAIGPPARAALEAAAKGPAAETAARARAVLADLYIQETRDALSKIEAAALGAKTFQLCYAAETRATREDREYVWNFEGTVLLKEGNRVLLDVKTTVDNRSASRTLVSDGKTFRSRSENDAWRTVDAPEGFRTGLTTGLLRQGGQLWFNRVPRLQDLDKELGAPTFPAEPPTEPDAAGVRSIRYDLNIGKEYKPLRITLWFDAKTLRLTKRVTTYDDRPTWQAVTTETYSTYVLDGDLPDERFMVP